MGYLLTLGFVAAPWPLGGRGAGNSSFAVTKELPGVEAGIQLLHQFRSALISWIFLCWVQVTYTSVGVCLLQTAFFHIGAKAGYRGGCGLLVQALRSRLNNCKYLHVKLHL